MSNLERAFYALLKNENLARHFVREFRFCPPRRWRFDFADLENLVAVELEGGTWVRGRHTRPMGFVKDAEKYNAAVVLGWRVLRYTSITQMANFPQDYKKIVGKGG